MLLHVQLDAIVHLCGRIGELTGVGHDQPDLDGLLRTAPAIDRTEASRPQKFTSAFRIVVLPGKFMITTDAPD